VFSRAPDFHAESTIFCVQSATGSAPPRVQATDASFGPASSSSSSPVPASAPASAPASTAGVDELSDEQPSAGA
jgi:hypothetical protein